MFARFSQCLTFLVLMMCSVPVLAAKQDKLPDIDALHKQGKLLVEAWIDTDKTPVPSEQLLLNVRIRTDLRFGKGTHIGRFDIRDAAVLRRMTHAYSQQITVDEKKWQAQIWQLEVYPNTAGSYVVPSIPVDISVYLGRGNNTQGTLYTKPFRFDVAQPAEAVEKGQWFAARQTTLNEELVLIRAGTGQEQAITGSTNGLKLEPGDSLVHTLTLTGLGTASMLLPPSPGHVVLNADHYPAKPELTNTDIEGVNQATRVEKHTYLLTSSGEINLPAITHWVFDTDSRSWQALSLPAHKLKVAGIPWQQWLNDYALLAGCVVACLFALFKLLIQMKGSTTSLSRRATQASEFRKAVAAENSLHALNGLYSQLAEASLANRPRTLRALDDEPQWQQSVDHTMSALFKQQEPKALSAQNWLHLWRQLKVKLSPQKASRWTLGYWQAHCSRLPEDVN